ncbi:MAG TPA: hypothetical protein VFQ53_23385 [Kofleriaceae bacterium]|nr:hypothetical protein [Kofleriaceae bacterium]
MVMEHLQRAQWPETSPDEVRACLEAAFRAANERMWVHRNVARIYRVVLGDQAAASRVLDELTPLTCTEWRLAAAAWHELDDRARAIRCLERAAANARTAADLCIVALGYRDIGYADEGSLLVDGAASIASLAIDQWIVANTFTNFGARERAVSLLVRSVEEAFTVGELVTLAHALATYGVARAQLVECLASAERRASTVRDWLQVAVAHHRLLLDVDALDHYVVRASNLALNPQDERDIAMTRSRARLQLFEEERAHLRPDQLLPRGARTFGFERDPARLLGWLRARVPRTTIDVLAGTDFLANDATIALLGILKSGELPHPLPAYLDAVREQRWQIGPDVDHVSRAFVTTLLCIDDAASIAPDGIEPTLAVLLDSCLELGPDAVSGAAALFAALADAYDVTQATTNRAHVVLFAELGLVLATAWLDPTDPRLDAVIDRLFEEEPRHPRVGPAFLLGLSPHGQRDALWRSLAERVLVHPRHATLRARLIATAR